MRSRRWLPAVAAVGAAATAIVALSSPGAVSPEQRREPRLPAPPAGGLPIGDPVRLGPARHQTRWAPVLRAVAVRAAPDRRSREVARLARRTPEATANIVPALARRAGADGRLWVRVRLPGRRGGLAGWVPRGALGGYTVVETRMIVDLSALTAVLERRGRKVFEAPVGVGTQAAPTPEGEFYVRNRLERYAGAFYGPLAFGTSARSPTLTDWPAGGYVGVHGTDRPDLIPGRVSHGCIRMRNRDILELGRLMPVGTPITIR